MRRYKPAYFALIVIITGIIFKLLFSAIGNPWINGKIQAKLNENKQYIFSIKKSQIHLLSFGIRLYSILVISKEESDKTLNIKGQIESVRIRGFSILKFIFSRKITIKSISFYNTRLTGIIPLDTMNAQPIIIPLDIGVDKLLLDKTNLLVTFISNSSAYSVKDGSIKVYDLHLIKNDTLSKHVITRVDFKAREFVSVSADSMYSLRVRNIDYGSGSNVLSADSFFIHPNYKDYNFTSMYKFQKDRIEAAVSDIKINDFNAVDYIRSGRLSSTFAEVGNLDLNVFRDKRKEFHHIKRPVFQELIYKYPSLLRLDTVTILKGNIIYRDHAEKAYEKGQITFNKISAKIYNISNDSVFRTKKAFLELRFLASFMGNSKLEILLKSKIFDDVNTFTVKGSLAEMEISDMNPYLENSSAFYATAGRIDALDFNFTADDIESKGTLKMLYNGLNITVKDKKTDDTTGLRERIISNIANRRVIDSNPSKGKEVRIGIIDYQRDPEKFLFSYLARSFLSGIQSSLQKTSKSK